MIKVPKPVRMIVGVDQLRRAEMIMSSPIRLMVGGRAIFVKLARSHQDVIRGRMVWKPRARIRVRVWVRS